MAQTIDEFKAAIAKGRGLAKPNRFQVELSSPLNENGEFLSILCKNATMPGRSISTFEKKDIKQTILKPYTFINDELNITFHLTNDYYAKRLFAEWMGLVINEDTVSLRYKDTYVSDMTIHQLDGEHKKVYGIVVQNAYPITMSEITLDNSSEGETLEITIGFAYDNFYEL